MKKLENILHLLRLTKQKYEKVVEANGERFNVFSLIELETNEVRVHSKIIAELLDPKGSHSQKTKFLRLFLEKMFIDFTAEELNAYKIEVEKSTRYGRIDIVLSKNDKCIVIENKINAEDQEEQLGRYYQYAQTQVDGIKNIEILYLTLDGSEPEMYTLGEDLRRSVVKSLSYQHDIIDWLESCIKEVARVSQIREILFQYQQLLKKLTGQTINKQFIMEAMQILEKDNNFRLIQDLENTIDEFKTEIQFQFWEELRELLIAKKVVTHNQINNIDRSSINKYYQRYSSGKYYYGLTFDLLTIDKEYTLGFKVEIYNAIYYGFRISKSGEGQCPECKKKRFSKYFEFIQQIPNIGSEFRNTQWWLGYKYARKEFDFAHFNNEIIFGLVKETTRRQLINELAEEISQSVFGLRKIIKKNQ